jgi:hypothetical protein
MTTGQSELRVGLQLAQDLPSARHQHVEHDGGRPRRAGAAQPLLAAAGEHRREALAPEDAAYEVEHRRIVIDDEDRLLVPLGIGGVGCEDRLGIVADLAHRTARQGRDADEETRALAELARDRDVAAHHPAQLAAHREAEPGAAVLAGDGGVALREVLEQALEPGIADADAGVGHGDADPAMLRVALAGDLERDPAALGELAGVTEEIEHRLPQLRRVARHAAEIGRALDDELVAVDADQRPRGRDHVLDELGEIERLPENLHLAGLDLGEVEDVGDEREQVLAGAVDALEIGDLLLATLGLGVLEQHLAVADDRVERRAQLVAHAGEELGLGEARALGAVLGPLGVVLGPLRLAHGPLGLVLGLAQLDRGRAVALHLALELRLRGDDVGVVEGHHRDIGRGAEQRHEAGDRERLGRHALREVVPERVEEVVDEEVGADEAQRQPAQPRVLADVEEGEERRGEKPRQVGRAHAAVVVGGEERDEAEILHRQERERGQPVRQLQQPREQPEAAHRRRDRPQRRVRRRVDDVEMDHHRVAEERPEDVAEEEHAGAPMLLAVVLELRRDEPVQNRVDEGSGRLDVERHRGRARLPECASLDPKPLRKRSRAGRESRARPRRGGLRPRLIRINAPAPALRHIVQRATGDCER